jgi:pimeloyl-ACP methyl ester carboxylesterase
MAFIQRFLLISLLFFILSGCSTGTPTSTSASSWTEESVTFSSGANQIYGVLTLPNIPSPFPAIVLISGSANEDSGLRSGASNSYLTDQAHNMVKARFAVLRYDPPGVGKSTGDSSFETLDDRVKESMAALNYLQTRPDIRPDRIGLWGVSQGGWVIEMAAADNPQDVAFIISVSGSGVSVAEQQAWGVETQSRAAGLSESDIAKAVLFSRLLIDWQLSKPIYQQANETSAAKLGDGPWQDFMKLVYEPGKMTQSKSLQTGINILETIQDESWTNALYLKTLYLPQLRSISRDQAAYMKGYYDKSLLIDPKDFLPRVTSPVLAFFGEADQLVPAQKSAELYKMYLSQAENKNFKIVVFPNADHGLNGAIVDYWKTLFDWLGELFNNK